MVPVRENGAENPDSQIYTDAMPVERHFLGWDAPVTAKVREFLLPADLSGPVDLGSRLIVVPTRQAGRRLREAMALYCAGWQTALLSPRVEMPNFFFRPEEGQTGAASWTEAAAAWAGVLMEADLEEYHGLFPGQSPEQTFAWAMQTGEAIHQLRKELVDGGYGIADVREEFGGVLEEPERWGDLARLERAYLQRLERRGLRDPFVLMLERSREPELPDGIERIVVAAVPDPTPVTVRALERLAERVPVDVLIHAPESIAGFFDGWGRPVAEKWRDFPIEIPDPDANIILAGSPSSQSGKVLDLIAAEKDRFGPGDVAVGVPDGEVTPFLESTLADMGLPPFDPSGRALSGHPLYSLLEVYRGVVKDGTYPAVRAFLRHADILDHFERACGLRAGELLKELDEFQNEYLPLGMEDIGRFFGRRGSRGEKRVYASLEEAFKFARDQKEKCRDNEIEFAVRSFLATVYGGRVVDPRRSADKEFMSAADLIDAALVELGRVAGADPGITKEDCVDLLLGRLGPQSYYPEREAAVIDLEGWLELPWSDAPFLIVTGMNEGRVPDGRMSDMFLPDSLRGQLGLRHDGDRLARDAFLMRGLIESRGEGGRVCFIAGKTSAPGNPLKPSRLLFRCGEKELPPRAQRLFSPPDERRPNYPSTVSFRLDVRPPPDVPPALLQIDRMSVTRFKEYLACPFRFYLKNVLGMEELDDLRMEMDPRDFGALVHHALHRMGGDVEMRACADESKLRSFLCAEAEGWVERRFGTSPTLSVLIQLESARQRLGAAARIQAEQAGDGWEIIEAEMAIDSVIDGMLIRGRIDRIDRHRETGKIRILDYKSGEKKEEPLKAHLAAPAPNTPDYGRVTVNGREKRWIDLQLPLYRMLLPDEEKFKGPVELGYFDMPKTVSETGVTTWEGFGEELMESARACARGVIRDIRAVRFWPPAEKVRHEDFGSLFHDDIAKCVDADAFTAFLKEIKKVHELH